LVTNCIVWLGLAAGGTTFLACFVSFVRFYDFPRKRKRELLTPSTLLLHVCVEHPGCSYSHGFNATPRKNPLSTTPTPSLKKLPTPGTTFSQQRWENKKLLLYGECLVLKLCLPESFVPEGLTLHLWCCECKICIKCPYDL